MKTSQHSDRPRRNFIPRNEGFVCEQCHQNVPPARGTFRNHCPFCFTSKHVDEKVPGDRLALCQGLLDPIAYEGSDPDKLDIIYLCRTCHKQSRNRRAPDDDIRHLFHLIEKRR